MQQETLFPMPEAPAPSPYRVPCYTVRLVREASILYTQRAQLRCALDVAALFRAYLGDDPDREYFLVAMVDQRHRVIGINTVSIGSLTASLVTPREVFKPALLCNAAAILVCHNHPAGDPTPSQEDRLATRKLVLSGETLGIQVLDHVILGDGTADYFSFADNNAL